MGDLTKGSTLDATGCTRAEIYAMLEGSTINNGAVDNAAVSASAAIVDTKLATIATAGKVNTSALTTTSQAAGDILYNNGTTWERLAKGTALHTLRINSGATAPEWAAGGASTKHYRKGFTLKAGTTADTDIMVTPGVIDVGGTTVTSVADSSTITITTASNWKDGSAAADTTDVWIYVYIDASGNIKLDENAPVYSYSDETTAEFPMRYHKQTTTYYRCIGAVYQDASSDLCWASSSGLTQDSEGQYVSQFDASNICIMNGVGDGADQTFNTIWTPRWVKVILGNADATPAASDNILTSESTTMSLDGTWDMSGAGADLATYHAAGSHQWQAAATEGAVKVITSQSAGTAGSFTIHAMPDGEFFYAIAYTDIL